MRDTGTVAAAYQQFYTQEAIETLLARPGCLAVIRHDSDCVPGTRVGEVPVGLESLDSGHHEVICAGTGPVTYGREGRCHWRRTEEAMFAALWLTPSQCAAAAMAASTEAAYGELLALFRGAGFGELYRVWNYLPRINEGEGDWELYKQFCAGRHSAFETAGIPARAFPAASALGHYTEGAVIYALAGRHAATHHENPKQQAAYCYPRQYGPKSPSFARATSARFGGESQLFISGTASILGHETQAVDCIEAQVNITLDNIVALIEHIEGQALNPALLKIYLRRAEDLSLAKALVESRFPTSSALYIHADICRRSLLVEIEAHCHPGRG